MLIHWKNIRDPIIVQSLLLGAYHVHMMGSIVNCMQALGIKATFILGGCTYICEPVDIV